MEVLRLKILEEKKKQEEERARKAREIELQKAEQRNKCYMNLKICIVLAVVGLLVGIISLIVHLVGKGLASLIFCINGFVWFALFVLVSITYKKAYEKI